MVNHDVLTSFTDTGRWVVCLMIPLLLPLLAGTEDDGRGGIVPGILSGVPQAAILSPLFNIYWHSLAQLVQGYGLGCHLLWTGNWILHLIFWTGHYSLWLGGCT